MLVDWFTVGAQVLNFIVLVWLLKRYLYAPILDAIDAREKRISDELASADQTKAEAIKERDDYERKSKDFDEQRSALLLKATDEAKAERHRLVQAAGTAADELSAKRHESLRLELRALSKQIDTRTRQEVFAIARTALKDLAAADLNARMVATFTQRLRAIDRSEASTFSKAINAASGSLLVRSAYGLAAEDRSTLQTTITEVLGSDVRIRFEVAADLISGIELTAGGHKIAWSIQDYLGSLEADVSAILDETDRPASTPEPLPATSQADARTP